MTRKLYGYGYHNLIILGITREIIVKKLQIFSKEKNCYEIKKTEMFCAAKDSILIDQKSERYLQSHVSC